MTIENRIIESEQKYNELQNQRNELIKQADDILTEMTKLQGEWRVLQELLETDKKPNKKATVIEAVPEKEG